MALPLFCACVTRSTASTGRSRSSWCSPCCSAPRGRTCRRRTAGTVRPPRSPETTATQSSLATGCICCNTWLDHTFCYQYSHVSALYNISFINIHNYMYKKKTLSLLGQCYFDDVSAHLAHAASSVRITDSWHRASSVTVTLRTLRETIEAVGALVTASTHRLTKTVALTYTNACDVTSCPASRVYSL